MLANREPLRGVRAVADPGAEERAARAAILELEGMDADALARLIQVYGSAAAAWQVGPARWPARVRPERRAAWAAAWARGDPAALLAGLRARGIEAAMPGDPAFPAELAAAGAAPLLYLRGDPGWGRHPGVAVVGTRRMTAYGAVMARRLAGELAAAGLVVVSGLARGVDAEAHRAALEAGGATVAVLGSGLEQVYPPEHRPLAERIAARGLLLSAYPPRRGPQRHHFPDRNRLLAALALAVVVVEAPGRSGALLTAAAARELGRPVLAVPGRADAWASAGCLELLHRGEAAPCRHAGDVLAALGQAVSAPAPAPPPAPAGADPVALTPEEQHIYAVLAAGPLLPEELSVLTGLPMPRVWAALTRLELAAQVVRVGSAYARRPRGPRQGGAGEGGRGA